MCVRGAPVRERGVTHAPTHLFLTGSTPNSHPSFEEKTACSRDLRKSRQGVRVCHGLDQEASSFARLPSATKSTSIMLGESTRNECPGARALCASSTSVLGALSKHGERPSLLYLDYCGVLSKQNYIVPGKGYVTCLLSVPCLSSACQITSAS